MNKQIFLFAFAFYFFTASISYSADQSLKAGEYLTEGGGGDLTISSTNHFTIDVTGGNAHTCSLKGVIHNGQSVPDEQESNDSQCVVSFIPKDNGIEVTSNHQENCTWFCGARAQFEGLYLQVFPSCVPSDLDKIRKKFKQLYDKKSYSEAYTLLAPVFQQCENTLFWVDEKWLRNDLALTAYKLGNTSNCQQWLQPLLELLKAEYDNYEENAGTVDDESLRPIIKATRTNAKLCGLH